MSPRPAAGVPRAERCTGTSLSSPPSPSYPLLLLGALLAFSRLFSPLDGKPPSVWQRGSLWPRAQELFGRFVSARFTRSTVGGSTSQCPFTPAASLPHRRAPRPGCLELPGPQTRAPAPRARPAAPLRASALLLLHSLPGSRQHRDSLFRVRKLLRILDKLH